MIKQGIPWYYQEPFMPARPQNLVLWVNSSSWDGHTWQNLAPSYTNRDYGTLKNGVAIGDLLYPSGVFGAGLKFDGTDDYICITYPKDENLLWAKSDNNFMINGMFGSMWYNGLGDYHAHYSDGTNVLHATSLDGESWTVDDANNPVLTPSSGKIGVAMVWKEESTWYMLYRSNEWGNGIKIGLATSDDGLSWTKNENNPVLSPTAGTWDAEGLPTWGIDPWGIIKVDSAYYLWYNTIGVSPRATGLATSTDLINWTKDANNPIFERERYCIFPFKYGDYYYMLVPYFHIKYVSGDVWDIQIRLYRDSSPTFYPDERDYLGIVLHDGGVGEWDDQHLDTPSVLTNDIYRNSFPDDNIWMYYSGYSGSSWTEGLAKGLLDNLPEMVAVDEPNILYITDAITIEAWINIADYSSDTYGYIATRENFDNWALFVGGTSGTGRAFMQISSAYVDSISPHAVLSKNTWYHIVATYDKNKIKLYINGVFNNQADCSYDISKAEKLVYFGNRMDQQRRFNGIIDEVRIYETNLQASEVWHNYVSSPIYMIEHGIDPFQLIRQSPQEVASGVA